MATEIAAQKKQYKYWREKLLPFFQRRAGSLARALLPVLKL